MVVIRDKIEHEFLEIIDGSSEGSFIQDLEKGEVYYSSEWKKRLGIEHLSPREAVLVSTTHVHPEDRESIRRAFFQACERKAAKVKTEFRLKTVDSGYIWVLGQGKIIYNQDGRPIKYYGTHSDISENKKAEAELKSAAQLIEQQNRKLNAVIQSLPHGLVIYDKDANPIFYNEQAARGYDTAIENKEIPMADRVQAMKPMHQEGGTAPTEEMPIMKALKGEVVKDLEMSYMVRSGERLWVSSTTAPIINSEGEITGAVATYADITERKRMEQALRESEAKYRAIVENAGEGIAIGNIDGLITFVNQRMANMLSYDVDEMLGRPGLDFAFPDWEPRVHEATVEVRGSDVLKGEFKLRRKDGSPLWTHYTAVCMFNEHGEHVANMWLHTDITERKQAESEKEHYRKIVEDRVSWLQAILDILPAGVWISDQNGQVVMVNQVAIDMYGGRSQLAGRPDEYTTYKLFRYDTGEPVSFEPYSGTHVLKDVVLDFERFDGTRGTLVASTEALRDNNGNIVNYVAASVDITELQRAEEALRESEERQTFLLKLSDVLRPISDPVKAHSAVTSMAMDYFKSDRCYYCEIIDDDAVIRQDASQEGLPSVAGVYPLGSLPIHKTLMESGQPLIVPDVTTTKLVDEELREICIQQLVISYLDIPVVKEGKLVGILCIVQSKPREWTQAEAEMAAEVAERTWASVERAKAEEEVRKARNLLEVRVEERTKELFQERQRLLDVLETLPVNICLLTPDYQVPFANRAFRERFGESNGRHCYNYIFGYDQPCADCRSFTPLETGQPIHWLFSAPDGRIIDVYDFPFTDADGSTLILEMNMDITEQRRTETEMARLDRLNMIGEMAASIGHEIRNPMTSVRGFLQLLGSKPEYEDDSPFFELMIEELDGANAIITEYLSMAKDKMIDLQPNSLDVIITALYPMLMSDANLRGIKIHLALCNPPQIKADEREIRQLITNMARNGMEAMSDRGTLTIATVAKGDEVVLYIKDEGHGVNPDLMEKLGTPFLTTKENGTGLGLAVCYSVAARHNATIDYETGPSGTTFFVRFPINAENSSKTE